MPIRCRYGSGGSLGVCDRAHHFYGRHFKKCMPKIEILMGTFKERVIEIKIK